MAKIKQPKQRVSVPARILTDQSADTSVRAGKSAGKIAPAPFLVVGIGASAGGLEALSKLLHHLRPDTGMAFVVVMHLAPEHESQLSRLLAKAGTLPVQEIRQNVRLEPNKVYVMPPNAGVTLDQGWLRLSPLKTTHGQHMPVDTFFRSLAEKQQNRSVGMVLSGTGTDGTLGLQAIKGAGGITFAQDEKQAKFFGMPGSAIAAGCVDFVSSPEAMVKELSRIARHPYVGSPPRTQKVRRTESASTEPLAVESTDLLNRIFTLLRARTGVDFSLYKHSTLSRRIARRMVLLKLSSLRDLVRFLQENPTEVDALYNELLINVTSFFRDPQTFRALKTKAFPKLLKNRPAGQPLRFWTCGCATGEEAYSLAMSVVEYFEQTQTHMPVQIFATDISEVSIEKARAGIYPGNIALDVSAERLRRFFTKVNGNYQVHKSIRDMCIFARQNVILDPPFSNVDLITCRNLLIYLGPLLQQKIMPLFHYALRPTGFLMLGSSETIGSSAELFTLVDKKNGVYTKKTSFLRRALEIGPNRVPAFPEIKEVQRMPANLLGQPQTKSTDLQQHVDKLLLTQCSPSAVVVNSHLDVLQFRGRTGKYLEHAPGSASLNLLKMAREGLAVDLRTAISKAGKQGAPFRQESLQLRSNGRIWEVALQVIPFQMTPTSDRYFLVVFEDAGQLAAPAQEVEPAQRKPGRGRFEADRRELHKLRTEVVDTKESLQSIIEEYELTHEELKSANEEIQSSNEELQSTNEELETAKEELQSTNEELTTLNEELQNRNGELGQVNNDLTNLLNSVNVAVLMLGNDLTIRRYTPRAEKIFNLIPSDIGRKLSDLNQNIVAPKLDASIKEVIEELSTVEQEVQDRQGRWYSLLIRPYRTRENKIEGAVLILTDIDEFKRSMEAIMAMSKQPLLALYPDLRVKKGNESFYRVFQMKPEDAENKSIYDLADGTWDLPRLRGLLEGLLLTQPVVENYSLEGVFPPLGQRTWLLTARKLHEEGKRAPAILLALKHEAESELC